MGDLIATHQLTTLDPKYADQIYNALDTCVTFEVWEQLQKNFNQAPMIYNFERALQAPALEIMMRGFKIDQMERERAIKALRAEHARLEHVLHQYSLAIWDRGVNARSGPQLKELFYKAMKLPEVWTSIKGVKDLRMNRETLEKIEVYFHARPVVACVLGIRELEKKLQVLESEVDPDGRMRTSINVGATETGRFSSSKSTTGTGANMFNIAGDMRRMFVADKGWKLCAIDLEQAESREVGWICGKLFNDWKYLDACESDTDLHTYSCRLIWPNRPWTGDPKKDRLLAEDIFYRGYSYRDMSKRGGHGSNYLGQPFQIARILKVPPKLIEDFQDKYFSAFTGIPKWHRWVAEQVQTTQQITTGFGRNRHFFGRPNDDATLREAVAYEPQSCTADRLNIGLLRIWEQMGNRVQVLLQLYDAVYFQYHEDDNEAEVLQQALSLVDVPLEHNGRRFTVPGEIKVGWNWASAVTQADVDLAIKRGQKPPQLNLDGLKKWKGSDDRKRTSFLDRIL